MMAPINPLLILLLLALGTTTSSSVTNHHLHRRQLGTQNALEPAGRPEFAKQFKVINPDPVSADGQPIQQQYQNPQSQPPPLNINDLPTILPIKSNPDLNGNANPQTGKSIPVPKPKPKPKPKYRHYRIRLTGHPAGSDDAPILRQARQKDGAPKVKDERVGYKLRLQGRPQIWGEIEARIERDNEMLEEEGRKFVDGGGDEDKSDEGSDKSEGGKGEGEEGERGEGWEEMVGGKRLHGEKIHLL